GAIQWQPKDGAAANTVPDAHVEGKYHAPMMFTTDLALKEDPAYRKISKRFLENPDEFELAFAKAWFKLTHRDMGPQARYIGPDVPDVALMWQDPIPEIDYKTISDRDITKLKKTILDSGLSVGELVRTAWASASTYRNTDMRGGANGARIRLAPQKDWSVNDPDELSKVLKTLKGIQTDANDSLRGNKKVSMADLIVLGGAAAIEQAAKKAGYDVEVPFTPGRADATQEQTEVESFQALKPTADAFRNYYGDGNRLPPTDLLVDRADLLGLTVPEMTALLGGLRVLDTNAGGTKHGVFTNQPGTLSNDFFVNLLSMSLAWTKSEDSEGLYEVRDRATGEVKWTATPVDLIFGSNAELRAVAEVYGSKDGEKLLVDDFIDAWVKVMTADRFDLKRG
ncbi:MAG: catalase-peroxidase, partial [Proteobacteria bacterium]|nr:catalase-peroxidase [Pseudomonadota bacterium]